MTPQHSATRARINDSTTPGESVARRRLASRVRREWADGEIVDSNKIFSAYPELRQEKSFVLDVAYEEFCGRIERGEIFDPKEFAARFPDYRRSLMRLLQVHDYLAENTELLAPSPTWPKAGDTFLGFKLREEIGRGSFARVFLAEEASLGDRLVVVKLSHQGNSEAETLAWLRHPNIVLIHSFKYDDETHLTAVCMPYLARGTLDDWIDRILRNGLPKIATSALAAVEDINSDGALPTSSDSPDRILGQGTYVDAVIHWGVQIADALAHTHSQA